MTTKRGSNYQEPKIKEIYKVHTNSNGTGRHLDRGIE